MDKHFFNMEGGQSADLDLDKEFLMLHGQFSAQSGIASVDGSVDDLLADLELDRLEYGADPDLIAAMNEGPQIASPATPSPIQQGQSRQQGQKGAGISAFAKGLSQGLGGLMEQNRPRSGATASTTTGRRTTKTNERPNWVIPALIGAIGIGIVVFAMGKKKNAQTFVAA